MVVCVACSFYQLIKLLFVFCIMVSYPLQFYVPMERIEKWITRRINPARQTLCVYTARWLIVTATCENDDRRRRLDCR